MKTYLKSITKPHIDDFQPIPVHKWSYWNRRKRGIGQKRRGGTAWIVILLLLIVISGTYLFPWRTNIVVFGLDYLPHREQLSRTDTIILITATSIRPYLGLFSIPRDLWVSLDKYGENRINSAYFYSELDSPGSGPSFATSTISKVFGISVENYLVVNLESLCRLVDILGGVDLTLPRDMGGLVTGNHKLTCEEAMAFARSRTNADDFSRMEQGQVLIKAILNKALTLRGFQSLPLIVGQLRNLVETNLPLWQILRLGVITLFVGDEGIDMRAISREMVHPFTTIQGAQVLQPNWEIINPNLYEMFGE